MKTKQEDNVEKSSFMSRLYPFYALRAKGPVPDAKKKPHEIGGLFLVSFFFSIRRDLFMDRDATQSYTVLIYTSPPQVRIAVL